MDFMFFIALAASAVIGYLLGSVNSAILICRAFYGQDIRKSGSGNAGMTNVARTFGKKAAILTLACDILKGVLGVVAGHWMIILLAGDMNSMYGAYIGAIFVIIGHMFPVFFGFKGGKGVATSCGVVLALQFIPAVILITLFLVIFFISKMVSLGSLIGIAMYPIVTFLWCTFVTGEMAAYSTVCTAVIAIMVIWMHRANIGRILSGTEYKFGQKKKED